MALIKSISGIRGTIGGLVDDGLNPINLALFSSAYAQWIVERNPEKKAKVVVGRDARLSGEMVSKLVIGSLLGSGVDVLDLGLATTPTVELAVTHENAQGGIIVTASHNPRHWNALKLLNEKGEFLSEADGKDVLGIAQSNSFNFPEVDKLGKFLGHLDFSNNHINQILELELVDVEAIRKANFKVVIDCVNSVGGIILPQLLKNLGVAEVIELYCEPTGEFPHNPEPLPEHLHEISSAVVNNKAHLGFVVDPDVDRLAIVCEDGSMFGEEYTLVAVADYVLGNKVGNTVSNLSSTAALRDITQKHGGSYFASAVGEVNVVEAMKKHNAIIGGEGNGGVIYPQLHYGRDALVGVALFLSHLAKSQLTCTELKSSYPQYFISKNKLDISSAEIIDSILARVEKEFSSYQQNKIDGLKIEFENGWVHLRRSNTEPIIRIYAESSSSEEADKLAKRVMEIAKE